MPIVHPETGDLESARVRNLPSVCVQANLNRHERVKRKARELAACAVHLLVRRRKKRQTRSAVPDGVDVDPDIRTNAELHRPQVLVPRNTELALVLETLDENRVNEH